MSCTLDLDRGHTLDELLQGCIAAFDAQGKVRDPHRRLFLMTPWYLPPAELADKLLHIYPWDPPGPPKPPGIPRLPQDPPPPKTLGTPPRHILNPWTTPSPPQTPGNTLGLLKPPGTPIAPKTPGTPPLYVGPGGTGGHAPGVCRRGDTRCVRGCVRAEGRGGGVHGDGHVCTKRVRAQGQGCVHERVNARGRGLRAQSAAAPGDTGRCARARSPLSVRARVRGAGRRRRGGSRQEPPPGPPTRRKSSLLLDHLEAAELAEHLTHLEHRAFARVHTGSRPLHTPGVAPLSLARPRAWRARSPPCRTPACEGRVRTVAGLPQLRPARRAAGSPALQRVIALSNGVSRWVQLLVLSPPAPPQRARVLTRFLHVAQRLLELRNFNTLMAVVGGLGHGSITRLRQTLALLPPDVTKVCLGGTGGSGGPHGGPGAPWRVLGSCGHVSRRWWARGATTGGTGGCWGARGRRGFRLPALGVHLRDLVALEEALPDWGGPARPHPPSCSSASPSWGAAGGGRAGAPRARRPRPAPPADGETPAGAAPRNPPAPPPTSL
ncbi:LOW QUALITY PROTEIN: RAS guanyl-releasing protein 2-like, partial [Morphnus guianensis]